MSVSRPLVVLAGAALAGLALVGVGASATFTDSTTSTQKITAGGINVVVSAAGTSCPNADYNCKALTLPDVGPVGSKFETPPTHVLLTNKGSVTAYFDAIQMSDSNDNSSASLALRSQMNVCIQSLDTSGGPWVEGNGPLTTALALHPSVKENPVELLGNTTAEYWVSFYAGKNSTGCATTVSDGTNTRNAWMGYSGPYATPASLTQAASGGSDTVTLTFSFTG